MKKKIIGLLCIVYVFFAILAVGALAEELPGGSTTTDASSSETGITTEPEATTDPTVTENTTGVTERNPGFIFSYNPYNTFMMTVEYNAEAMDGLFIVRYILNNTSFSVTDDNASIVVPLEQFASETPGRYPISFVFSDENGGEYTFDSPVAVEIEDINGNSIQTAISVKVENGRVTAIVTDQYGKRIPFYPVVMRISDVQAGDVQYTNKNGSVTFSTRISNDIAEVVCVAKELNTNRLKYLQSEGKYTAEVTQTSPSTTPPSNSSETKKTNAPNKSSSTTSGSTQPEKRLIFGPAVPTVRGTQTGLGFVFNPSIPGMFGCSESDFAAKSKLFLETTEYNMIVENPDTIIMALAQLSEAEVTDHMILAAISGKSQYSTHHSGETTRIILDLMLSYVNSGINEASPLNIGVNGVDVEIPVPNNLSDPEQYKIAVALLNNDMTSIEMLYPTTTANGMLSFSLPRLGTIVLLGFQPPTTYSPGASIPLIILSVILIGFVMLGSAIFLLYFFFLRRVKITVPVDGIADEFNDINTLSDASDSGDYADTPAIDDLPPESPPENIQLGSFSDFNSDEK